MFTYLLLRNPLFLRALNKSCADWDNFREILAELPASENLKSGDPLFRIKPTEYQRKPPDNGNGFGYYMKYYMKYMFHSHLCRWWNSAKKPQETVLWKKNWNSDKNFQPKRQKSSKVDFILGDLVTHLGEQEVGAISGTLLDNLENIKLVYRKIPKINPSMYKPLQNYISPLNW